MFNNGNKNVTKYIMLIDTETMKITEYDSKKTCADAIGIRPNVVDVYLDKNLYYKKRWVLQSGDQHPKKIYLNVMLSPMLLNELEKITNNVPNTSLVKLTSAITKDFVFRYKHHNNTIKS
jgi:hypothetical protein